MNRTGVEAQEGVMADAESIVVLRIAELRKSGIDARPMLFEKNGHFWIVVVLPDGRM